MHDELLYILALQDVEGIGDVLAKQLISYCGSAEAVFKETRGRLSKIPNIGAATIKALNDKKTLDLADQCLTNCEKLGISIIPYYCSEYPQKLKLVNDAPLVIFNKGQIPANDRKVVGIVGTRQATSYGKDMTSEIVKELVAHDALIVSGLAYGIDITAHRAALASGLPTIGVLAGGLDKIYPAVHKKTAIEMLNEGSILSEKRPGAIPEAHNFPARNRIIAGMSDAVIVVEAAERGGALITANIAYSYDREVFAVPGEIGKTFSEGCNALIRSQKANIYTSVSDLEYLLNWEKGKKVKSVVQVNFSELSEDEQRIIEVLSEFRQGLHLDELSWKSHISVNQTVSLLLNLEFSGIIRSLPGKMYQRVL